MQLSEILRQAKKKKKLTLKQLGELSSISFSQIAKIERGEHIPSRETIIKLTEALNLDTNKFLQNAGYNVIATTEDEIDIHLRYKVLNKYNFTCQLCGISAPSSPLYVSTITPLYMNGKLEAENLIVLCKKCDEARVATIQSEGLTNDVIIKRKTINEI